MIIRSIAALSLILLSTVNHAEAANATTDSRLAAAECSMPNYRPSWVEDELAGNVKLAVLIDADGTVQETKVISSSGHLALDKASARAGTQCKFQPASNGSEPVWAQVQYNWVLN